MGLPHKLLGEKYDDIVGFAELEPYMERPVKTYSSGMYVRLAFAVATCVQPDILIVDELLSVGDGAFARKSFDRIMSFKSAGSTILFCSHSLHQVESICNRVLWIDRGELVMDGAPGPVVAAYSQHLMPMPQREEEAEVQPAIAARAPAEAEEHRPPLARLERVWVSVDGRTAMRHEVVSGESEVSVAVDFVSLADMPVPSVGVVLLTDRGFPVASAGTLNDRVEISRDPAGHSRVALVYPQFPLLKGRYYLNVFLLCEQGIHIYDVVQQAAELHVAQKGLERGLVSLPRRWEVGAGMRGGHGVSPTNLP